MNPQPPRGPRFTITEMLGSNAPGMPRRLLLDEKEQVIGRSDQADLIIPLRTVSRRHAAVWAKDGEAFVRDLGSRSGTFVNSARVSGEPTPLRSGDRLSFRPSMVFLVSQEDEPLTGDSPAEPALFGGAPDGPHRGYVDAVLQLAARVGTLYDESKLLSAALEALGNAFTAERFFAMLGSDPADLRIVARRLANPERSGHKSLPSKEILRRTLGSEEPVLSFDAQSDERFCRRTSIAMSDVHSVVAAALRVETHCLGVLYADNHVGAGRFSLDDGRFMQAIARVLTIELLRLRTHTDLQQLGSDEGLAALQNGVLSSTARLEELAERLTGGSAIDTGILGRQLRAECRALRDLATRTKRHPRQTMVGIGKVLPPD